MASVQEEKATLDDLHRTPDRAEMIGGRIVRLRPAGMRPAEICGRICRILDDYATRIQLGEAFMSKLAYAVPVLPSGRESFSPDTSYHRGPFPHDPMKFISGAPHFAVEVRKENDYTPDAELRIADKRSDYFLAGTEVVWDVDTLGECIHAYRASDPNHSVTFVRGEIADAEPALPGWRVAVDWVFQ